MSDAELARAATLVDGARQVALACHVNPDGDALGSMLGMFHVLRAAGPVGLCAAVFERHGNTR